MSTTTSNQKLDCSSSSKIQKELVTTRVDHHTELSFFSLSGNKGEKLASYDDSQVVNTIRLSEIRYIFEDKIHVLIKIHQFPL